jgi:hypothetical protein
MIGFDKYHINHGLLMGLTLEEMTGTLTHDRAKTTRHPFTLGGTPIWTSLPSGFPCLSFDSTNPDYLACPAADSADLNFTSEDFTLAAWLYSAGTISSDYIFSQGFTDTDGWTWYIFTTNIALRTNQAGSHTDISSVDGFVNSVWQLAAVTRSGASGQFYRNGEPIITSLGTGLLDPVSCAGGNIMYISSGNLISNGWKGYIALPRIWNRELSDLEMYSMFEVERHWFGV